MPCIMQKKCSRLYLVNNAKQASQPRCYFYTQTVGQTAEGWTRKDDKPRAAAVLTYKICIWKQVHFLYPYHEKEVERNGANQGYTIRQQRIS